MRPFPLIITYLCIYTSKIWTRAMAFPSFRQWFDFSHALHRAGCLAFERPTYCNHLHRFINVHIPSRAIGGVVWLGWIRRNCRS